MNVLHDVLRLKWSLWLYCLVVLHNCVEWFMTSTCKEYLLVMMCGYSFNDTVMSWHFLTFPSALNRRCHVCIGGLSEAEKLLQCLREIPRNCANGQYILVMAWSLLKLWKLVIWSLLFSCMKDPWILIHSTSVMHSSLADVFEMSLSAKHKKARAKNYNFLEKKEATIGEHAPFGTKRVFCVSHCWAGHYKQGNSYYWVVVPCFAIMHLSQPISLGYRKLV